MTDRAEQGHGQRVERLRVRWQTVPGSETRRVLFGWQGLLGWPGRLELLPPVELGRVSTDLPAVRVPGRELAQSLLVSRRDLQGHGWPRPAAAH